MIGVCGINPHAGENGLFGNGEEDDEDRPRPGGLRADGIDARGPLPADTAFFLAGRGDYDLIVAMYHDQGHGPVKVLGIEAGVNLTVGLPVIRTSVDHGTAFDIAGTGRAEAGSMVEALPAACRSASTMLPASARPVPAMSNAVPWSTEVRITGRPTVMLTPASMPSTLTGPCPWSWYMATIRS